MVFFSDSGFCGFIVLPAILHGMRLSHFACISFVRFGPQNCFAAPDILLMAGCPICSKVITIPRKACGITILLSKKSMLKLVDKGLWCFPCTHLVLVPVSVSLSRLVFLLTSHRL